MLHVGWKHLATANKFAFFNLHLRSVWNSSEVFKSSATARMKRITRTPKIDHNNDDE